MAMTTASDKDNEAKRKLARQRSIRDSVKNGAVTETYAADRDKVLEILDHALATEIVCMLRYKRHYFMASGIHAKSVADEFLEHAKEEEEHADAICKRIVQLGGAPNLSPDSLMSRSHAEYVEGNNLVEMLQEDLIAERIAIDSYKEALDYIQDKDPTTRRLLVWILSVEEEHAEDLKSFLEDLGKKGEPAKEPMRE